MILPCVWALTAGNGTKMFPSMNTGIIQLLINKYLEKGMDEEDAIQQSNQTITPLIQRMFLKRYGDVLKLIVSLNKSSIHTDIVYIQTLYKCTYRHCIHTDIVYTQTLYTHRHCIYTDIVYTQTL